MIDTEQAAGYTMNDRIFDAASRVLAHASDRGLPLRALGGVAIAMRCPSAGRQPLARRYEDLDLITDAKNVHAVSELLQELGFSPEERFNQLHGRSRMLFDGEDCHVDVLVDRLVMCHTLELAGRITVDAETLSLADLLLSKLQIVNLNEKDVRDITAVLADHDLTDDDQGINVTYIATVIGADWGWWRTATQTIGTVRERVDAVALSPVPRGEVAERLDELNRLAAACPKTWRWRARSRVGDRMPWYNDPEEVA
jgi:hypothetical protein